MNLDVLELFCGIGGAAAALSGRARVVVAVDQDRDSLDTYAANFPHPTSPKAIADLPDETWRAAENALWWLSPPCQPYTSRGKGRDLDDPRAAPLVAAIERIVRCRPPHIAMENVPPFAESQARRKLRDALDLCGYQVAETILCPTDFGVPMRRRRWFLVASRESLVAWRPPTRSPRPLREFLDPQTADESTLRLRPDFVDRYAPVLKIVDPGDPNAIAACFTSGYATVPIRGGSVVRTPAGELRRFSPAEIARLMGFPTAWRWPERLSLKRRWSLIGDSLSVDCVRHVLAAFPSLESAAERV